MMPDKQVKALIRQIRASVDASEQNRLKEELLEDRKPYLVASVRNYIPQEHAEFSNLLQVANLALLHAIDNFDTERDVKFSTYIYHIVRRHIYDEWNRWSKGWIHASAGIMLREQLSRTSLDINDASEDDRSYHETLRCKVTTSSAKVEDEDFWTHIQTYLDASERKLLEDHFIKGKNYQDIADDGKVTRKSLEFKKMVMYKKIRDMLIEGEF